jgi:quercetin dioxygenase-like cupin family protein
MRAALVMILGIACQSTVPATPPTGSRLALAATVRLPNHDSLQAKVVEVTYGPGESSAAHSHPCPVIVYVSAGRLRTQVRGEPEAVYGAGESFYEAAGGIHTISANASGERPARFAAVFLCDRDTTLSVAAPVSVVSPHD